MHPTPNATPVLDPSSAEEEPNPGTDTRQPSGQLPANQARLRSGTAARLAGLPVTTLRVWERRYGVVSAARSATGQRLYSNHDVARLRLLRQLSHAGHAIGTIASLELEPLQRLAGAFSADEPLASAVPARATAIAVGRSAAHLLETIGGCDVVGIFEDLRNAEVRATAGGLGATVDLLLLRLPSLQPSAVSRLDVLIAVLQPRTSIVLYAFGAEPTIDALQARGITVRREPVGSRELARLVDRARSHRDPTDANPKPVAARRFTDEALASAVAAVANFPCECVRHVAEIVMHLSSFERYSDECGSGNSVKDEDAAMHRKLTAMTGAARAQFEQALQLVMRHNATTPASQTLAAHMLTPTPARDADVFTT